MAMSKSVIRSQDILKCQLCETNAQLQHKCITCNLLICSPCCKNVHSKFKDADKHKIIDIKDIGQTEVSEGLDFRNIPCTLHPEQYCCLYCPPCEKLVCPTCVTKEHAGHTFKKIEAFYVEILDKLGGALSELEAHEKELDGREREEIQYREEEKAMYSKVQKEIETQRQTYKSDIDKHFDKLAAEVKIKLDKIEKSASNENKNISETRKDLAEKKTRIETLQSTRDAADFFNSTPNLLADAEVTLPVSSLQQSGKLLKFVPKYKHLPGELLGIVEEEEKRQVKKKNLDLKVQKEYTTDLSYCHYITGCSDGSYFIAQSENEDIITKIQIRRDNIKTIFTKTLPSILDINTHQAGRDILLADRTPTVKVMNGSTADTTESQYCTQSMNIIGVHVTMDNKVVVGARSPGELFPVQGRRVVIVMDSEGKHQAEWENNQRGDRLFSAPTPAASTRNGNIFVSDRLSNDCRGQVITLSPTGDVLNTYTGHPDINNEKHSFTPAEISRTPSDNVIVCDFNNHALHLLNNGGVSLSYFSTTTLDIQFPYCVIFDTKDRDTLYIGCTRCKGSTEKAKLYQVNCTEVV